MDRDIGHLPFDIREASANIRWIKIVGIGSANSGKTSLIKYFCENKFTTSYHATVAVDYGFKVETINGIDLRVHLWDMSGNDDYKEVRNELYCGSDAIFICYDVTDPLSFQSVEKWLKELQQHSAGTGLLVLVGNKSDLRTKGAVTSSEAKRFANQHGLSYFETSCLNGNGVHSMFNSILKTIQTKNVT